MTENSVRGSGRSRAGATDTTMLVWKVIAASPGIARSEIFERVEHDIPAGYACRRFARVSGRPKKYAGADPSAPAYLGAARSYVLSSALSELKRRGKISSEDLGKDQRYTASDPPRYFGNTDAIDETGTKAAEHMALADALRTAEKWLARAEPDRVARNGKRGPVIGPPSRKEYEAVLLVVKTLRAQGGAGV